MNVTRILLLPTLLAGIGCASLPPATTTLDEGFREVRSQPHYRISVRAGEAAWPAPAVFRLPEASLLADAQGAGITSQQADVIAVHAARTVCQALAPWVVWTNADDGGRVVVGIHMIAASSGGLAATSAVIDAVVPGPFRLPAGLGALGIDSRVEDASGAPLMEVHWARGANPLLHRARVSSIGDAWELAPSHARDLRDALRPLASAQPDSVRRTNEAACDAQFGRVNVAGRAASMFIPLSPEALAPSVDQQPEEKP